MPVMPPGSKTGVYYVPVGNLPWNTTWKRLKDHARNRKPDGSGLAVLHANVYPGQTSGWVSVQGLADFRAVVKHMNQSAMEDPPRASRTLQADDRNETHPVMLGESVPAIVSPSRQSHSTLQGVPQYTSVTPPQDKYPSWALHHAGSAASTPMSPSFSETSYYQPQSPHYNHTQPFNGFAPQNEYLPSVPPGMVLIPMPQMQQPLYVVPVEQQMQMMPHPPPQKFVLSQTSSPVPIPTLHQSPRVIKIETRKIIITGLPLSCKERDLQELINNVSLTRSRKPRSRQRNSPDGTRYYLQHLEIGKHPDGSQKGHAFAVLESHPTAKSTVDALNGLYWQGRVLHARFAKEGVESCNHEMRHVQGSDISPNRSRNSPRNTKGKLRETQVPRSMIPEPQYRYRGESYPVEVDESLSARLSNIQIDFRGDITPSPSLSVASSGGRASPGVSSLSVDGEKERRRKLLSDDTGSHTPIVVDGSSCGRNHQ